MRTRVVSIGKAWTSGSAGTIRALSTTQPDGGLSRIAVLPADATLLLSVRVHSTTPDAIRSVRHAAEAAA